MFRGRTCDVPTVLDVLTFGLKLKITACSFSLVFVFVYVRFRPCALWYVCVLVLKTVFVFVCVRYRLCSFSQVCVSSTYR